MITERSRSIITPESVRSDLESNRPVRHREARLIEKFVRVYCRSRHGSRGELCDSCTGSLQYARSRLAACPYDPKPPCRRCPTHCYEPEMRQEIRQIMRHSGTYFVLHGRVDWLIKYFLMTKPLQRNRMCRWRRKVQSQLTSAGTPNSQVVSAPHPSRTADVSPTGSPWLLPSN